MCVCVCVCVCVFAIVFHVIEVFACVRVTCLVCGFVVNGIVLILQHLSTIISISCIQGS